MQSTSYSRKVRISIVSLYDIVWFNRSLNGLATSFELHLPLFDCLCKPRVLTEIISLSLSPRIS